MGKRKWTAEQKISIVLQGIKGELPVAELCRQHGLSQTQYYKWRDLFLEGGKQRLNGNSIAHSSSPDKAKIRELERIIGQQTIDIQILKKIQEM